MAYIAWAASRDSAAVSAMNHGTGPGIRNATRGGRTVGIRIRGLGPCRLFVLAGIKSPAHRMPQFLISARKTNALPSSPSANGPRSSPSSPHNPGICGTPHGLPYWAILKTQQDRCLRGIFGHFAYLGGMNPSIETAMHNGASQESTIRWLCFLCRYHGIYYGMGAVAELDAIPSYSLQY